MPLTPFVLLGVAWGAIVLAWLAWAAGATTAALTGRPGGPGFGGRFVVTLAHGQWSVLYPNVNHVMVAVVYGVFAAVAGGAWCLPPVSPHDDGCAATVSALLLGMVTVLAVVRHIRCRGHGAEQPSTLDGAR